MIDDRCTAVTAAGVSPGGAVSASPMLRAVPVTPAMVATVDAYLASKPEHERSAIDALIQEAA